MNGNDEYNILVLNAYSLFKWNTRNEMRDSGKTNESEKLPRKRKRNIE